MRKLLFLSCVSIFANSIFANDTVVTTLKSDGSTNTWNQAELVDALGLMNRKYHRDMEKESGRQSWHGKLIGQYLLTNDIGKIYLVKLYQDGYSHRIAQRAKKPVDPEAAVKAAEAQAAAVEAARQAWERANLPANMAKKLAEQRAAEAANKAAAAEAAQ